MSLQARAEAVAGDKLRLHLAGLKAPSGGGGGPSRAPSGGGGAAAAAAAANGGGGGSGPAVLLRNEVDLVTVLNTVQLLAAPS